MLYHERKCRNKENAKFVHIVYLLAKLCNIFDKALFIDVSMYALCDFVNMSCQRSLLVLSSIKIRQLNGKMTIQLYSLLSMHMITLFTIYILNCCMDFFIFFILPMFFVFILFSFVFYANKLSKMRQKKKKKKN